MTSTEEREFSAIPIVNAIPELFFGLFLDRNPHLTAEEREFYVGMFSRPGTADAVIWDYRLALEEDPASWRVLLARRGRGRAQDHHHRPCPLDLGRIRPLGKRGRTRRMAGGRRRRARRPHP